GGRAAAGTRARGCRRSPPERTPTAPPARASIRSRPGRGRWPRPRERRRGRWCARADRDRAGRRAPPIAHSARAEPRARPRAPRQFGLVALAAGADAGGLTDPFSAGAASPPALLL